MKKTVHFLKKCGYSLCAGDIVCGAAVDGEVAFSLACPRSKEAKKQTTFKRSKVTCGNCKRTKAFRNRGKK